MSYTHREALPWTREQFDTIDTLSLEHGNAEVGMTRSTAGVLAYCRFEDGARCSVNEDGRHGEIRYAARA